jgi:hypothetical protein
MVRAAPKRPSNTLIRAAETGSVLAIGNTLGGRFVRSQREREAVSVRDMPTTRGFHQLGFERVRRVRKDPLTRRRHE